METNTKQVSNIKKIIAREGLIILGILTVAGFCGLTGTLIEAYTEKQKRVFTEADFKKEDCVPIKKLREFGDKIKAKYPEYKDLNSEDLAMRIVDKYSQYKDLPADISGLTKIELSKIERIKQPSRLSPALWAELRALEAEEAAMKKFEANRKTLVSKREAWLNCAESFQVAGIFILLLAYPLYLLARFIVWAIHTLRS